MLQVHVSRHSRAQQGTGSYQPARKPKGIRQPGRAGPTHIFLQELHCEPWLRLASAPARGNLMAGALPLQTLGKHHGASQAVLQRKAGKSVASTAWEAVAFTPSPLKRPSQHGDV